MKTKTSYTLESIEDSTSLMLDVIAEAVVEQAEHLLGTKIPEVMRGNETLVGAKISPKVVPELVDSTVQIFNASETFRKKVKRGSSGRDYVYICMEHWLASWLKKNQPKLFRALPTGYGWSYSPTVERNKEMNTRIRKARRKTR